MRKPQPFNVLWVAKNPSYAYSKQFKDAAQAVAFSNTVSDSLVYVVSDFKKGIVQHKLIDNVNSRNFIRDINLKRKVEQKSYDNFGGIAAEKTVSTIPEYQKSQKIRLVDVFVIAPICIYAGFRKELPVWLRASLIIIGASTAYYNAKNFYVNKKLETN